MIKKEQKINMKCVIFILVIYLLVLQNILQNYIHILQYFDEFLAILVFPVAIIKNKKNTLIKKDTLIIIILLLIILVSGMYSIIVYKYQSISVALSDALIIFKFFMVYFLSGMLLDEDFIQKNKSEILFNVKIIIYILFLCTICNYILKIWPSEYRFGIMSNKLFYGHQTSLAAVCIFLLSLLTLCMKEKSKKEIVLLLIILVSTLRFKAIIAAVIIFFIIIYIYKVNKKISFFKFIILGIVAVLLAYNQIIYYFVEIDDSARNQLLIKAFEIARDYFPVGTGFATYASHFSAVSYSIIYRLYGLSNIYGLTEKNTIFVSDTFWPMILGQFGVIGTICYLGCIYIIFKGIQRTFEKGNMQLYISKLICFIYLIISSTSESAFVHTMAIPLAIVIGISINKENKEKDNEK